MHGVEYARAAVAEGEFAVLEVAEELVPLGVGGGAVFFAGAELAAAVDEGPVAVDGFLGVDRPIPSRTISATMAHFCC